ncbi:MAG: hypothetical protein KGI37_07000 [Alphaproteobacteria bacterium]|nr:hypothetical protein [Alphaproteobacteria bacterium]
MSNIICVHTGYGTLYKRAAALLPDLHYSGSRSITDTRPECALDTYHAHRGCDLVVFVVQSSLLFPSDITALQDGQLSGQLSRLTGNLSVPVLVLHDGTEISRQYSENLFEKRGLYLLGCLPVDEIDLEIAASIRDTTRQWAETRAREPAPVVNFAAYRQQRALTFAR